MCGVSHGDRVEGRENWAVLCGGGLSGFFLSVVRASPAVWQIELSSLIFGKNVKNTPPTIWQKTWQFLSTREKPASSAQIYARGWHRGF